MPPDGGGKPLDEAENLLVLIPARDEEASIVQVIRGCRESLPGRPILVVDDGSQDETASRARQAGAVVLSHTFGMGYGAALHTGYLYALRKGFSLVVQLDADGQHDPKDLPRLVEPLLQGKADVTLGSRFLGNRKPRLSLARRGGILLFRAMASLGLGGKPFTDPTSGFQGLGARALEILARSHFPEDFPDADVLVFLARSGCRILEVPVTMRPRRTGRSMHGGARSLYYVYKMSLSLALIPLRSKRRKTG